MTTMVRLFMADYVRVELYHNIACYFISRVPTAVIKNTAPVAAVAVVIEIIILNLSIY